MSYILPATLSGALLTDREAIADAIYRFFLAFDHADEDLLISAITEDLHFEMPGFLSADGIPELKAAAFERISKIDTTHCISNIRVSLEGKTTAKATWSGVNQHVRPGMGMEAGPNKFMAGALYVCDAIKIKDGLWKMKCCQGKVIWTDGESNVMSGIAHF